MRKKASLLIIGTIIASLLPIGISLQISNGMGSEWNNSEYINTNIFVNSSFNYGNNVVIADGGHLQLQNLTFTITTNMIITIENGGKLTIENCNIKRSLENVDANLAIQAFSGSNITINNSILSAIGNAENDQYYFDGRSIWLQTENVIIENNTFNQGRLDMSYITLYQIDSAEVRINNNTFSGSTEIRSFHSLIIFDCYFSNRNVFQGNLFLQENGIFITNSQNISFVGNDFIHVNNDESSKGVYLSECSNITLENNSFIGWQYSIDIQNCDSITIDNNTIQTASQNINFVSSNNINIQNNTFIRDTIGYRESIFIDGMNYYFVNNIFEVTYILGNPFDPIIFPRNMDNLNITFDDLIPNKINGKNIQFIANIQDDIIDFLSQTPGMVYLFNITNSYIKNLQIEQAGGLVCLDRTSNLTFENINISESVNHGLDQKYYVVPISILNSNFESCSGAGIYLDTGIQFRIEQVSLKYNFMGIEIYNSANDGIINQSQIINNGVPSIESNPNIYQNYLTTGGGILINYGNNVDIFQNNIARNWYYGLMLGSYENQAISNFNISMNNLSQYIIPIEKKYSVSAIDNGLAASNLWFQNTFSEDSIQNQKYVIPGSANSEQNIFLWLDSDNDGASDVTENAWGSSNFEFDTDFDGLMDYDEIFMYKSNPNATDTDGEGLTDNVEIYETHTSPIDSDTDFDGFSDYYEWNSGSDGNDPLDFPGNNVVLENPPESQYEEPSLQINTIAGYSNSLILLISICSILFMLRIVIIKKKWRRC